MLRRLVRSVLEPLGVEVRRRPPVPLPRIAGFELEGTAFRFWIASPHTYSWYVAEPLATNAQFRAQKAMTPPGAVVFDVGAHHGMTSVLCGLWAGPGGQVHAFEPVAENALAMSANLGLNNLGHAHAVWAAVGAADGRVRLAGESVSSGRAAGEEVPLLSLDTYAAERGIKRVDFLKIDVEGYEADVLRGATAILAGRPAIDLELHLDDLAQFGATAAEVLSLLPPGYAGELMARPDWQAVRPFRGVADLPPGGVVNLFLRPA